MKRFSPFLVPLFFLLFFAFCGKKGPILPPLKRALQKIEVLDITQRGDKIILEWENPTAYTDGSSLSEISEVEIWLVEQERESGGEDLSSVHQGGERRGQHRRGQDILLFPRCGEGARQALQKGA